MTPDEMKKNPLKAVATSILMIICLLLGPFGWIMGLILLISIAWAAITEK